MTDPALLERTEAYVDAIFGAGSGVKHARFLERVRHEGLREMIHRYHALEGDTTYLSLEENYLLGMSVLLASKSYGTAALFAKTLLVLGTPREKIVEATARLSMWIGGIPAVEASFVVEKAIREFEAEGLASLSVWFPEAPRDEP
jgi:hypothetical protein